jgi:hypothetical protein
MTGLPYISGNSVSFPQKTRSIPHVSSNLDKYLPEFDEDEARSKLVGRTAAELTDMLIYEYKLKRVFAKMTEEHDRKIARIEKIIAEPSHLTGMPDIPGPDDLRRMFGDGT